MPYLPMNCLPCLRPMRRRLLGVAAALPLLALSPLTVQAADVQAASADGLRQIRLSGPGATVTFPLLRMVETQALADAGIHLTFSQWRDPDHLRALALEQGADFVAMPSNVAANLYNRRVPLQLANISVWGMLSILSRQPGLATLADLKGQEIAIPFRADMPDILFQLLAREQGLDPRRDFTLRYVATPMDAAQLLMSRKVDHALLSEPATSMVLRKSQSFPASIVAPDLYRSVDLQQEWGRVLERAPQIPQAGIVALGAVREDAALMQRFAQAYETAHAWCLAEPDECGALVARHIDMLQADAVAEALRHTPARLASAAQARGELEYFYGRLLESEPALVGGRLPDDGFYAAAAAGEEPVR